MRAAGQAFGKLDACDGFNAKEKEDLTALKVAEELNDTAVVQLLEKAGAKK